MNFEAFTNLSIPEGSVRQIASGDKILWTSGPLPSGYRQVEWIAGIGKNSTYIDVDIFYKRSVKTSITVEQHIENYSSSRVYIFGCGYDSNRILLLSPTSATHTQVGIPNAFPQTTWVKGKNRFVITAEDTVVLSNETTGVKASHTNGNTDFTDSFYLFAQHYGHGVRFCDDANFIRKISYFSYAENDILISEMYPCYRKSDGVIGMYDTVRKRFFTNKGTVNFTKGPEV